MAFLNDQKDQTSFFQKIENSSFKSFGPQTKIEKICFFIYGKLTDSYQKILLDSPQSQKARIIGNAWMQVEQLVYIKNRWINYMFRGVVIHFYIFLGYINLFFKMVRSLIKKNNYSFFCLYYYKNYYKERS